MNQLPKVIGEHVEGVLEPNERILDFIVEPWSYVKGRRWTILTNRRIILVKNRFFTYDMFTLIKLINVNLDIKEGPLFDSIFISYFDHKFNLQFYSLNRDKTLKFFHSVAEAIERVSSPSAENLIFDELEHLAKVFNAKIISEEEYERKRKDLLDRL